MVAKWKPAVLAIEQQVLIERIETDPVRIAKAQASNRIVEVGSAAFGSKEYTVPPPGDDPLLRRAIPFNVFDRLLQSHEVGVRLDLRDGRVETHLRNYDLRARNWRVSLRISDRSAERARSYSRRRAGGVLGSRPLMALARIE
jgi:hypothetical protein